MSSSIAERLQTMGMTKHSLQLNLTYVGFLLAALMAVGFLAYTSFNDTNYGNQIVKITFCLAAMMAGVAGHLLQGPFGHFSVILFFAIFNFFSAHYQHFSVAKSPQALTAMKSSAEILFWTLAFFGIIYLVFVFVPQINDIIPTADDAYKVMKRSRVAKMSAPVVAAPTMTA